MDWVSLYHPFINEQQNNPLYGHGPTRQPDLKNPAVELDSQVILGCVKLIIKAN